MNATRQAHTSDHLDKADASHAPAVDRDPGGGQHDLALGVATLVAGEQHDRLTPGQVVSLQRTLGNEVVSRVLTTRLQRHPEGKELPQVEEQVGEVEQKAQAAPEATRTKDETDAQTKAAKESGAEYQKANKLSPGAMSLASAQKVLQGIYGGVKTIVPGSIVILADQPACCAKYDEVCMADKIKRPDGSDWKKGDCAKDDAAAGVTTEGFAWKGVVYVNGKTKLVTATAHEILHNNVSAGFRNKMGETFNEGTTETLARNALTAAGVTVPAVTAYPDQIKLTAKLITVVGLPVLCDAYFSDSTKAITKWEELKGAGTFANLKKQAEALNVAEFDKAIAAKKV